MRNFQRDQALLNDYLLKVVEDLERLKPAARRRQSQSDGPGITDQGQVALDAIILHFPDGDDPRFSVRPNFYLFLTSLELEAHPRF
jgi:ribosomal 50S subunit-associated protein YjgA (DUF615 family)